MKPIKDIIKLPRFTEKAMAQRAKANQYTFEVACDTNKVEIRKAIETRFEVKVENVRTVRLQGKIKRGRGIPGRQPEFKKAYVRLRQGDVIKEFE
jgi:large subunit ribosomal protein L23